MGKFLKRLKRTQKSRIVGEYDKALDHRNKVNQQVHHATCKQIIRDKVNEHNSKVNTETLILVSAHTAFGFGKKRLERLQNKAHMQYDCIEQGYITVAEVEKIIDIEGGILFGKNPQCQNRYQQIVVDVTDKMIASYFIALMDEYGFKSKRLKTFHNTLVDFADTVINGKLTVEEVKENLAKIMQVGK